MGTVYFADHPILQFARPYLKAADTLEGTDAAYTTQLTGRSNRHAHRPADLKHARLPAQGQDRMVKGHATIMTTTDSIEDFRLREYLGVIRADGKIDANAIAVKLAQA